MSANQLDVKGIKCAILVMSGKGGVGKSTVASQLAMTMALNGSRVGLLDIDICGPSLARMIGSEQGEVIQTENGWSPVKVRPDIELYLMSMAFLMSKKDSAVIWRGPKKHSIIQRFITGVAWGDLDCLVVDTPPGTSDEHISLVELLQAQKITSRVVLVTTPQIVACNDVRREISFCRASGVEISGLIENMSGYTCPHCSECTKIFSSHGGASLCKMANIKFLGSIPIDPNLCRSTELGGVFAKEFESSQAAKVLTDLAGKLTVTQS